MPEFLLKFVGVSHGNPGHTGAAASLYEISEGSQKCIWFDSAYLGSSKTSNQAEYSGLILGLENCVRLEITNLEICGDSELVIDQLSVEFKVKHKKLIPLYKKAKELIKSLRCAPKYTLISQEDNQYCEMIANMAVDRAVHEDEEDDSVAAELEQERNECFGFTRDEFDTLLSYGVKPCETDFGECMDVIQALYD